MFQRIYLCFPGQSFKTNDISNDILSTISVFAKYVDLSTKTMIEEQVSKRDVLGYLAGAPPVLTAKSIDDYSDKVFFDINCPFDDHLSEIFFDSLEKVFDRIIKVNFDSNDGVIKINPSEIAFNTNLKMVLNGKKVVLGVNGREYNFTPF